jgi:glycosyltransferase involved in cell wall biosynthesis
LLVVTLADAAPGPAPLVAARLLPWAAAQGLRPVLVLGDVGAWRARLEGHGPVISADRPDDYAAARFLRWTRAPRGLRPLRWLRARWWRLRLRGAGIVALSGPLPEIAARVLPPHLRARSEAPALPGVLPPSCAADEGAQVVGVGPLQGWAGADLWLRVVHELRARGWQGRFVWVGVDWDDDPKPFDHECAHLGLHDVVERRGPDADDGTAVEVLAADLLLLSLRPGTGGLPQVEERLPGFALAGLAGAPPVVGFVGAGVDAAGGADSHEVQFPDVAAAADEVERTLDRGPADIDAELAQLLQGAWRR